MSVPFPALEAPPSVLRGKPMTAHVPNKRVSTKARQSLAIKGLKNANPLPSKPIAT